MRRVNKWHDLALSMKHGQPRIVYSRSDANALCRAIANLGDVGKLAKCLRHPGRFEVRKVDQFAPFFAGENNV